MGNGFSIDPWNDPRVSNFEGSVPCPKENTSIETVFRVAELRMLSWLTSCSMRFLLGRF